MASGSVEIELKVSTRASVDDLVAISIGIRELADMVTIDEEIAKKIADNLIEKTVNLLYCEEVK